MLNFFGICPLAGDSVSDVEYYRYPVKGLTDQLISLERGEAVKGLFGAVVEERNEVGVADKGAKVVRY